MADKIFDFILAADPEDEFNKWFLNIFETHPERCSIEEFAVYFLNFLRNHTEEFIKGNSSSCNTPRKIIGGFVNATSSNIKESNELNKSIVRDLFACDSGPQSPNSSGVNNNKKHEDLGCTQIRKRNNISEIPLKTNFDTSFPDISSTPIKNVNLSRSSHSDSRSFGHTTLSPIIGKSNNKSTSRKNTSSPMCLNDFILTSSTTKQRGRKTPKSSPYQSDQSSVFSENNFPILGQRGKSKKTSPSPASGRTLFVEVDKDTSVKPKKRVAPITLSTSTAMRNDFCSPAFRADNNILNVSYEENVSRHLLKTHIKDISKDFQNEKLPDRGIHAALKDKRIVSKSHTTEFTIDIKKAENINILNKLINIHSAIIDLNLTMNILSEISYLLNLLNTECEQFPHAVIVDESVLGELVEPHLINHQTIFNPSTTSTLSGSNTTSATATVLSNIFKNLNNCVYFSLGVLNKQKHILALLDMTTIKVLLENERLSEFNENIKEFLLHAYSHKLKLESLKCGHDISFKSGGNMNVFYQQENDTKNNFPSAREFLAFKKQRDLFYSILRAWEGKHYNPSWIFEYELGSKVRSLLGILDHPINMAHLAKLFVSQLILSCNFEDATPELQLALPQVDLSKLSKLQQRLNAPSHFSTDYLFPDYQAFFKDFVLSAQSCAAFIEQLKFVLIFELIEMNNSSFETLHLSAFENDSRDFSEYVVRPETISTLRVLAKFLGLIITKPYMYDGLRNAEVDNRQIKLRNMLYPVFDIRAVLTKSIADQKLMVTIPWLVQYLSMLDYVTLRLDYFTEVLNILYELYIVSNDHSQSKLLMRPTSLFILKSCLGWLFEQPNVPDEYYKYRQSRKALTTIKNLCTSNELISVQIMVPKSIVDYFDGKDFVVTDCQSKQPNTLACSLQKHDSFGYKQEKSTFNTIDSILSTMDPMLENILNSACPFLADFRVSIMPLKHSKTVSRTGRFRHITTKIAETSNKTMNESDNQTRLAEAFLHSQSLSVRRTMEFVVERTVSAVIKDFQMEVMLPAKKQSNEFVGNIQIDEKKLLMHDMYEYFTRARDELMLKWDELTPEMIWTRVEKAFDALLPNETLPAVKLTCINLAVQKCKSKTLEWKTTNLLGIEFFSKDIAYDAEKILRNRQSGKQTNTTKIVIDLTKISPSEVFSDLQIKLHMASLMPNTLDIENLSIFLKNLGECLTVHMLPPNMYKITAFMVLQLLLLLVCNRQDLVTGDLLNCFTKFWKCKTLDDFTKPPDDSEEVSNISSRNFPENQQRIINHPYIFNDILSIAYIYKLKSYPASCFDALEKVLVALIKSNFLTIAVLNNQSVALLREEWPHETLQQLSMLLQNVVANTSESQNKHELLFLEMLSDLSRDIDFLL